MTDTQKQTDGLAGSDAPTCSACGGCGMLPGTGPDDDVMNTPCPKCNTVKNIARERLMESIWKKQEDELLYWLREHLGPLECRNVSIHEIDRGGGGFSTILYDIDDKSAVLIQTDTTAPTVEQSHDYMMIEPKVLEKLASLFCQTNSEPTGLGPVRRGF